MTERPLTLRVLGRTLADLERDRGLIVARRLVAALDYDRLTSLARGGGPDDDPALLDPRHVLLWGMRGPEVAALQAALVSLGYPASRTGTFDDDTLAAYRAWLGTQGRVRVRLPRQAPRALGV